jgi:hypothetical protein
LLTSLTPGGFEVGLEGEPGVLPPPHPHSSTRTESSQEKLDGSLVASFIVPPPVSLESVIIEGTDAGTLASSVPGL